MRLTVGLWGSGQSANFYITVINIGVTHLTYKIFICEDWILEVIEDDVPIIKWLILYKRIYYLSLKMIFPWCIWVLVCSLVFVSVFFVCLFVFVFFKCGIWATSVTYTTACGHTGSLTHWVRPGIKPASSWILVRLISLEPQQQLPRQNTLWPQLWQYFFGSVC